METFDILFESVFPKLVRYLIYTYDTLSEGEIEELASDALTKVYKGLSDFDFDAGAKLTTWVFTIAWNTAMDRLRQLAVLKQKAEIVESDTKVGAAAVVTQVISDWSRSGEAEDGFLEPVDADEHAMLSAFEGLSESDQDILRLRSCLDYDEISKIEKRDEGALRTRHSRALQRLKVAYKKELENGGA